MAHNETRAKRNCDQLRYLFALPFLTQMTSSWTRRRASSRVGASARNFSGSSPSPSLPSSQSFSASRTACGGATVTRSWRPRTVRPPSGAHHRQRRARRRRSRTAQQWTATRRGRINRRAQTTGVVVKTGAAQRPHRLASRRGVVIRARLPTVLRHRPTFTVCDSVRPHLSIAHRATLSIRSSVRLLIKAEVISRRPVASIVAIGGGCMH